MRIRDEIPTLDELEKDLSSILGTDVVNETLLKNLIKFTNIFSKIAISMVLDDTEKKQIRSIFQQLLPLLIACGKSLFVLSNQNNFGDFIKLRQNITNLIIMWDMLPEMVDRFPEFDWVDILKTRKNTFFPIHCAVRLNRMDAFELLMKLYSRADIEPNLLDNDGNTLLHLAYNIEDEKSLEAILELSNDLNLQNNHGNTALHIAAIKEGIELAQFLLARGANPEIKNAKGGTFFSLAFDKPSLSVLKEVRDKIYQDYANDGVVLSKPVEIDRQKGHTCGAYALSGAGNFHIQKTNPESALRIFAKTSDIPPHKLAESTSLVHIAKKVLEISKLGEILSAEAMLELIQAINFSGIIRKIDNDYNSFIHLIEEGIKFDFPILFPFAINEENENPGTSKKFAVNPHWALIIGCKPDKHGGHQLLVLQWGKYFSFSAQDMLSACCMPKNSVYPKTTFFKTDENLWVKEKPTDGVKKIRVIPKTKLKHFYNHVIFVTPADFNDELLKDRKKNKCTIS